MCSLCTEKGQYRKRSAQKKVSTETGQHPASHIIESKVVCGANKKEGENVISGNFGFLMHVSCGVHLSGHVLQ